MKNTYDLLPSYEQLKAIYEKDDSFEYKGLVVEINDKPSEHIFDSLNYLN
jgi:hypothetical protein